jgi:hypothetical protein
MLPIFLILYGDEDKYDDDPYGFDDMYSGRSRYIDGEAADRYTDRLYSGSAGANTYHDSSQGRQKLTYNKASSLFSGLSSLTGSYSGSYTPSYPFS